MPHVEVSRVIKGEGKAIYELIQAMEDYPSFMEDLESVTVLERGPGYDISAWVSKVDGRRIAWTERDEFYPEELRITYRQTEGDLKKMEGDWTIKPQGDGCLVTLSLDFEFGIAMIAGLLNPILKRKVRENGETMLAAIQRQVEGA